MSAPDWSRNERLYAELVKTTQTVGTYVGDEGGLALVNVGEETIPVKYATRYKPRPNDGVVLQFFGNRCRLLGPILAKSKLGTVTVVAHPYLTITCDGRTYDRMPYTVAYQTSGPKVGDRVAIDWDGGYVEDKVTIDPDSNAPPKLTTAQKAFTIVIHPKQSGSYETAKKRWNGPRGDLLCDSKHSAGWFYGTKVRDTLKNDAYISSLEVFLSLRVKKGEHPKIGRHYDRAQADGVSVNQGIVRAWTGWVRLPTDWAEAWRTDVGGVSVTGGESIYRGIGTDRQSGALRIRGRQ